MITYVDPDRGDSGPNTLTIGMKKEAAMSRPPPALSNRLMDPRQLLRPCGLGYQSDLDLSIASRPCDMSREIDRKGATRGV